MKRSNLLILAVSLIAVACQPKAGRFTIEGQIAQADGKTMYLDQMGLEKVTVIDSVKLDAEGNFSFKKPANDCFEFYRLRIDRQTINLVIDSTETVTVKASLPVFQVAYTVDGSNDNMVLKDLVMRQMSFLQDLKRISDRFKGSPEVGTRQARILETVDVFKSDVKSDFILKNPASPVSYYALFMSVGGQMLFDAQGDRQDAKCFAAVATQMDMIYPEAIRTKHLHNVALKGMAKTRPAAALTEEQLQQLESLVVESGIIDIELPDIKGRQRKLSDEKGKVVLLDFTAYKTDYNASYTLLMHELYNKYAEKGLEIYQVSFDTDDSFWANTAANLPWICVHDEASLNSEILKSYNISQLPSAFLIDRNGDLVDRPDNTDALDGKIAKLLAK